MLNLHKLAEFLGTKNQSCVVITESDLYTARAYLKAANLDKTVLIYPSIGGFAYDPAPPFATNAVLRLQTIRTLKNHENFCLLTSPLAWLEKRPVISDLLLEPLHVQTKDQWTHKHLIDMLVLFAFQKNDTVTQPGQFSVRGDRMDIFPPNMSYPIRLDFFGDVIEAIKVFDPGTQKSITTLPHIKIFPSSEFILDPENINYYKKNYEGQLSETEKEAVEGLITQGSQKNMGHLWPLFYPISHHIRDFWQGTPNLFIEPTIDLNQAWENIQKIYTRSQEQGRLVLPPAETYTHYTLLF